jgi:hypothetical protein
MKAEGIYAVPFYSVETLYYHPDIQRYVAHRQAVVIGGDPEARLNTARDAILRAAQEHAARLSERIAEKEIRAEVFKHLPTNEDIRDGKPFEARVDVKAVVAKERTRLDEAIKNGDALAILCRYPMRETQALNRVAQELGFQNRQQCESAVLKLLIDKPSAVDLLRRSFGDLAAKLAE